MEEKINVAEILKDKPQGTKLYSILSDGDCFLNEVSEDSIYIDIDNRKRFWCFTVYGSTHSFPNGCVLLFPSREMRDWEKFSWKKGDVLVTENGAAHIIFEKFTDDTYTIFAGKCYYCKNGAKGYTYLRFSDNAITEEFTLETEDAAKTYISFIEKRLGGKLNRETLEIEKAQPEFKNGDIVSLEIRYIDSEDVIVEVYIVHGDYSYGENLNFYAGWSDNTTDKVVYNSFTRPDKTSVRKELLRYATEEERQQLFKALANEGKAWDAEKKMIVVLKSLWTPKPFDKVLVRNSDADKWLAGFFEKFEKSWNNPYHIMNLHHMTDFAFKQCIPYEGNESLLGTTKDVEGQLWAMRI